MSRRGRRVALLGVLAGVLAAASGAGQDTPLDAASLLSHALEQRYRRSVAQRLELVVRSGSAEQRSVLEMASMQVGGRLHALGRLVEPEWLRGMTLLHLENRDRTDDHFVYLPSEQRVRRVTSAQRADAFLGTDLRYEDFERRRVEDFAVVSRGEGVAEGECVHVLEARPRYHTDYERVVFEVACADRVILEARYFKRGGSEPARVVTAHRHGIDTVRGVAFPRLVTVRNLERRTETRVRVERLLVDPPLDAGLFSRSALEHGRPIPGL